MPEAFLANLSHRPGAVAWFFLSHDSNARGVGKGRVGRSGFGRFGIARGFYRNRASRFAATFRAAPRRGTEVVAAGGAAPGCSPSAPPHPSNQGDGGEEAERDRERPPRDVGRRGSPAEGGAGRGRVGAGVFPRELRVPQRDRGEL